MTGAITTEFSQLNTWFFQQNEIHIYSFCSISDIDKMDKILPTHTSPLQWRWAVHPALS